ncbi:MAG: Gfo/Idh/MocA family oxidoreductase [Burkholderiales bacterium]
MTTARLRWGILGNARIAREQVIPAIRVSRNGSVEALASRDAAAARPAIERHAIPTVFDSYEALLTAPDVDALYIPLPNSLHVEWMERALLAGKHVLCEKPLAMHADEIAPLIAARDRTGRVAGEAFMVAHHPQWALVRQWIDEGRIGALRVVDGAFTYFNRHPDNIRNRADLGGGALRDIGVYPVVTTRLATGREPVDAQAVLDRDPVFRTDRLAVCRVDFGDFVLSFYCGTQASLRQQMVFHGETGFITLSAPFNAGVYDVAKVTLHANDGASIEERRLTRPNQYQLMVENFADAVAGAAPLAFPLESSLANQRVIDRLFESAAATAGAA